MPVTLDELKQLAAKLSEVERAELALSLIESLESPAEEGDVAEAWRLEIERRIAEFDRGEVQPVPADEVFARVRRQLG